MEPGHGGIGMRTKSSWSVLLVWVTLPLVLSSCTLRLARHGFDDEVLRGGRSSFALEGGGTFGRRSFAGGDVDLQLLATYQRFDFERTDAAVSHVEFRGRYLPLSAGALSPFIAGGLGVNRIWAAEKHISCRNQTICWGPGFAEERSPSTGLNPHVGAGVELRMADTPWAVIVGATREFITRADDWDLDSWRVSAGLAVRPK